MAVSLLALRAGHTLPLRKIPGVHFCWRLSRPQGHSAAARICKLEKSTAPGLERVAFRLVSYCLNQLRYHLPRSKSVITPQLISLLAVAPFIYRFLHYCENLMPNGNY
jgi:hypothetical protein